MAVNINVPSQVRTFANLAAFPATGALKTIYIAEDTNKTYRWTGSVYVEVSASASGITIGTTAIASGVVGRVLFEGAGNVVQESSSLFWDATNNRLGIGTSSPAYTADIQGDTFGLGHFLLNSALPNRHTQTVGFKGFWPGANSSFMASTAVGFEGWLLNSNLVRNGADWACQVTTKPAWTVYNLYGNDEFGIQRAAATSGVAALTSLLTIKGTGNVLIGTTTDAGFKLDVNGTARVQGNTTLANTFITASGAQLGVGTSSVNAYYRAGVSGNIGTTGLIVLSSDISGTGTPVYLERTASLFNVFSTLPIAFSVGSERMRIFSSTGNVGINTTTDAGFRLDVNGTARVSGLLSASGGLNVTNSNPVQFTTGFSGLSGNCIYSEGSSTLLFMNRNSLVANFYNGGSSANQGIQFGYGITSAQPPNTASALLDLTSTTKGFLPPRMTTTQKNAIASPAAGLMVYDTTLNVISYYNGTMWI